MILEIKIRTWESNMFSTKVKIWHNFFLFFLLREWDMINLICKMILSVVTSIGLFLPIMQLRQFWDWFLAPLWNEWVDKFSQKKKREGIYDQKLWQMALDSFSICEACTYFVSQPASRNLEYLREVHLNIKGNKVGFTNLKHK